MDYVSQATGGIEYGGITQKHCQPKFKDSLTKVISMTANACWIARAPEVTRRKDKSLAGDRTTPPPQTKAQSLIFFKCNFFKHHVSDLKLTHSALTLKPKKYKCRKYIETVSKKKKKKSS